MSTGARAEVRTFASPQELLGATGADLGHSPWHVIDQSTIDAFADATGDHQWIHVDPARAAAGPFGATVAHGYLTLALLPRLVREVYAVEGARMAVNYGLNRVRFPAPVRSGSSIRAGVVIDAATQVGDAVQVTATVTIEIQGETKPACVAESVSRFYA
jgi:acyl dehydratase